MTTCYDIYGYDPEWDTGICSHCHKPLTDAERAKAVHGTVHFGWDQYMHQWCFDWLHPVFISREEARKKWYTTHPELWND